MYSTDVWFVNSTFPQENLTYGATLEIVSLSGPSAGGGNPGAPRETSSGTGVDGKAEAPAPPPELRRGFFVNSTTAASGAAAGMSWLFDPVTLALIGIGLTLLSTAIQSARGK